MRPIRQPDVTRAEVAALVPESRPRAPFRTRKEARSMVPILLWILGVPGLIILLLLLFGVIHL